MVQKTLIQRKFFEGAVEFLGERMKKLNLKRNKTSFSGDKIGISYENLIEKMEKDLAEVRGKGPEVKKTN